MNINLENTLIILNSRHSEVLHKRTVTTKQFIENFNTNNVFFYCFSYLDEMDDNMHSSDSVNTKN